MCGCRQCLSMRQFSMYYQCCQISSLYLLFFFLFIIFFFFICLVLESFSKLIPLNPCDHSFNCVWYRITEIKNCFMCFFFFIIWYATHSNLTAHSLIHFKFHLLEFTSIRSGFYSVYMIKTLMCLFHMLYANMNFVCVCWMWPIVGPGKNAHMKITRKNPSA